MSTFIPFSVNFTRPDVASPVFHEQITGRARATRSVLARTGSQEHPNYAPFSFKPTSMLADEPTLSQENIMLTTTTTTTASAVATQSNLKQLSITDLFSTSGASKRAGNGTSTLQRKRQRSSVPSTTASHSRTV